MKLTKLDVRYWDVYASYQGENCVYFFIFAPRPVRVCVVLTGEALTDPVVRPDWKVLQSRGVCYYPPSRQVQPTAVWREGFIHNYRLERCLQKKQKTIKPNRFPKL